MLVGMTAAFHIMLYMHSGYGPLWKITKEDSGQKSNHHTQGKHLLARDTATCWINWNPAGSVSWHRAPRCDFEAGKCHFHNRVYYSLVPVCCFGDRQWSKPCQCGGRGVVPATIKLWSAIFVSIITRICICSHCRGAQGAQHRHTWLRSSYSKLNSRWPTDLSS